jgi:hypothetical protein
MATHPSPGPEHRSPDDSIESAVRDYSIVVGGPVYDFLLRSRIVAQNLPNILRRVVALVVITWVPLLLLSIRDGVAFGNKVRVPFLYDFSAYGRFLLALPLLIIAEIVIDPGIRMVIAEITQGRFIRNADLPHFESILRTTQRWRDSAVPEIALLVFAFFPLFLFQREWSPGVVSSWHTTDRGLTAAGWFFAVFSAPLLRFITYRWTFRYVVWASLLWRLGRMPLVLVPTHPDHDAGLNFLAIAQRRFGILFCALGCVFAGRVADTMVFESVPLSSFESLMGGFVVMSLVVALLPLALLAPKLRKVRVRGLLEYGRLANAYSESFDRKWVHPSQRVSEPLLGTSDIQSLADMANSFALVGSMSIVPITKRLILQLAAQTALPLLPLIVIGTPTSQLARAILKMIM